MTNGALELGRQHLGSILPSSAVIVKWKRWLGEYELTEGYSDDGYAWLTCVLALKAVASGNFGVGCVIVDSSGKLITQGHNEVFNPYFRSNRHAEMVVMDELEDRYRAASQIRRCTLYTSLESCPMCMARLITSRLRRVFHVASDVTGGMVHLQEGLPEVWRTLAGGHEFRQADCSPALITAAGEIFLINASELNLKLSND